MINLALSVSSRYHWETVSENLKQKPKVDNVLCEDIKVELCLLCEWCAHEPAHTNTNPTLPRKHRQTDWFRE